MKTKITIDLPSREDLLRGLEPRQVYQALVRAESDAAKAEQALERARPELAELERTVAELPARVQRGELKASALTDALRERDARARSILSCEASLAKARERLDLEQKTAAAAVQREIERRAEVLGRVAAELAPVLAELHTLSDQLARAANPLALGGFVDVDWPCAGRCDLERRIAMMSSAPAPVSLAWGGKS